MTALPHTLSPHTSESPWALWYERHYGVALRESGADPDFVGRLFVGLTYPWRRALRIRPYLALEEIDRLVVHMSTTLDRIDALVSLVNHRAFRQLEALDQCRTLARLRQYRHELRDDEARFREVQQCADADDPLLPLLRRVHSARRRKGQPSQDVATLFMVLLADHVREQTGKPLHRVVGRIAANLFPGCFRPSVLNDPSKLRPAVEDRCKKFKWRHDVPQLRTAVLSITEG
jgi:hypothetical protein